MRKVIKSTAPYVDLTIILAASPEDVNGPPVRYFF